MLKPITEPANAKMIIPINYIAQCYTSLLQKIALSRFQIKITTFKIFKYFLNLKFFCSLIARDVFKLLSINQVSSQSIALQTAILHI